MSGPACDLCGSKKGVRRVADLDVRDTIAGWIRHLCPGCVKRYRHRQVAA